MQGGVYLRYSLLASVSEVWVLCARTTRFSGTEHMIWFEERDMFYFYFWRKWYMFQLSYQPRYVASPCFSVLGILRN